MSEFQGSKFVCGRDGGDYYSGEYVMWLEADLARLRAENERLLSEKHDMLTSKKGREVMEEKEWEANAISLAWGIIANVSGGNWEEQTEEWQQAAIRWRDRFWHRGLEYNLSSDARSDAAGGQR